MMSLMKLWTVCVLVFVNLLNYMDRYTIPGVLPLIQNGTINGFGGNVNDKEAGLLTTSFVISFILASLLFGYLGDRYTRKYIMAFGIFLWSGFVLAGSFSVNYFMLLATRCMVGIGEASYSAIALTLIADLFVPEKRIRVLAVYFLAIPMGSAIGFGASALVSDTAHDQFGVNESWRWAFRITPALGVVAVLLILSIKEPARGQSDDPRNKKGVKGEIGFRGYYNDIKYLLKTKTFLLTSFGYAAVQFSVGAIAQWAPTLIWRMSQILCIWEGCVPYSDSASSVRFAIIVLISGAIGTISGSELSKFISRWTQQADCIVCALGLLLGTPFTYLCFLLVSYNLNIAWVMLFLANFFISLTWTSAGALVLYIVVPERRATAQAFQSIILHLAGDASSPFIIGAISDEIYHILNKRYDEVFSLAFSLQYSLYLTTFVAVFGAGLYLWSTFTVERNIQTVKEDVFTSNVIHNRDTPDQSLNEDIIRINESDSEYEHDDTSHETDRLLKVT